MKRKLHHMVVYSRLRARTGDGKKFIYPSYSQQQLSENYYHVKNYKNLSFQLSRRFIRCNNQERSELES